MKIHRFVGQFNLDQTNLTITDSEVINQWKNVLRLAAGEKLILADGQGYEAEATIIKLAKNLAEVTIGEKTLNQNEPDRQVTLYCAILKKENFELVVQKAIEVGISKIVPVTTDRTVKQNLRFDRLEKIAKEAAEQSGRGIVPTISKIVDFKTAITEAVDAGPTFLFDLATEEKFDNTSMAVVSIFIGPEGGFTDSEVALAKEAGAEIASLGPRTLRGETAAIVASYLVVNSL